MITGLCSKAECQLFDSLDLLITVEALQILLSFSTCVHAHENWQTQFSPIKGPTGKYQE